MFSVLVVVTHVFFLDVSPKKKLLFQAKNSINKVMVECLKFS